ncbi:dTDP-4-dehydrorhamnose reductase [Candidatus Bathyarchaeota archaeon]|nr:dTDP-4-dehydrorhamnose reductase [Candidatus Bathyarchaeota archaeon]
MRIAVIGANGQLGTDLVKILSKEHKVIGLTHHDIEVTDRKSCLKLKKYNPDIIINTAAFHKTELCEEEPFKTFSVNAIGAKNIAEIACEIDATAVYISTDYIFDGLKNEPYTEEDEPNPINTYGISKLAGELYTRQNPKHYIIRVASLFGVAGASGKGGNFVETMITKAKNNEQISVVDDMWMSPTYTVDAAKIVKAILEKKLPFGVYHATNSGYCTWFQFAKEIFKLTGLKPTLKAIKTRSLQFKAKRPRFSALKSIKLPKYGIETREWKQALYDYLIEKGHILTP